MKLYNNLKLGHKLTLSFIIIAPFIGVVGFIEAVNMKQINSNAVLSIAIIWFL